MLLGGTFTTPGRKMQGPAQKSPAQPARRGRNFLFTKGYKIVTMEWTTPYPVCKGEIEP